MVRRLIFLAAICSLALAGDLQVARTARPLLPGEGQAINNLIARTPKVKYKSAPNLAFRTRMRTNAGTDAVDTVRVLALRVEFQPDTSPLTTGNGKMDYRGFLTPQDGLLYDPPHTKLYFEKLMQSMHNFYALNSLGKFEIEYRVAPNGVTDCYQLPHDMLYYGDTTSSEGIETGLTRLFRDAVKIADEDPSIRFSDYDLFVVFHAGSTGQSDLRLDSPFDLLTGTLNENTLQAYLGQPYVLADEGQTRLTAASIIPEMARQDTLYANETNILGMTGVEGLLYHEFNHLLGGLDLYDITYNTMGVGSWSLMGYGGWLGEWALGVPPGVIPGMLDPWHRTLYGWIQPLVVNLPKANIHLWAAEMDSVFYALRRDSLSPTILKIPITPTEYFLVENRETDVKNKDTLVVHTEYGVPVYVFDGEYDFFQPGSGVLIWHIDEAIVDSFGIYNAVNIFPNHKGIDLVEGDGIQDYDGFSGKSSFDYQIYGSKYDPFFLDGFNDSLSATTTPNSDGYGGKSFTTVYVASNPDTMMFTNVFFDLYQHGFPQDPGRSLAYNAATFADLDSSGTYQIIVSDTGGRVSAWNPDGSSYRTGMQGGTFAQLTNTTTHSAVAVGDIYGDNHQEVICGADNRRVYAFTFMGGNVPGFPVTTGDRVTAAPVLFDLDHDGKKEIIVGSTDGWLYVFQGDGTNFPGFPLRLGSELRSAAALTDTLNPQIAVLASDGKLFLVNTDGSIAAGFPQQLGYGSLYTYAAPVTGDIDRDGSAEIVCVTTGGYDYRMVVTDLAGRTRYESRILIRNPFLGTPALADINLDGLLETILASRNGVYAFNYNATLVNNFPALQESTFITTRVIEGYLFDFENPFNYVSSPVVADLDGDGVFDFLVGSPKAGVLAFSGSTARLLDRFPLATTGSVSAPPLVCDIDHDGRTEIAVGSDDGVFHVWKLPAPGPLANPLIPWAGYLRDAAHTGLYPAAAPVQGQLPSQPLVKGFYIYPNPADKRAAARFRLGDAVNATASIKILDASGLPIRDETMTATPLTDNDCQFNVQDLASGIYIVRLEVNSDQGKAVKFCKLAIVR